MCAYCARIVCVRYTRIYGITIDVCFFSPPNFLCCAPHCARKLFGLGTTQGKLDLRYSRRLRIYVYTTAHVSRPVWRMLIQWFIYFLSAHNIILYYNVHNMFCPLTRSRFCHTRDCCARAAAAATATAPGVESIGRETCERCANNTSKPVRGMWTI